MGRRSVAAGFSPGPFSAATERRPTRRPYGLRAKSALVLLSAAILLSLSAAAALPDSVYDPIEDVPGLPRVLLIGDSISIYYTFPVRALLEGRANVHRIPDNAATTAYGLENIDAWLGEGPWDVIHFNWGLHDLKHELDGKADKTQPNLVPLPAYEKNLDALVERLERTGARLIWASTTYVPDGESRRCREDLPKYNETAQRVMAAHKIPTDDLYTVSVTECAEMRIKPNNVHFTDEGSARLAQHVAKAILDALGKNGDCTRESSSRDCTRFFETKPAPGILRAASVQMPVSDSIEDNLARIAQGVRDAAAQHARIVLFPETALSGFDRGTVRGLDWAALDAAMARVAALARENSLYILYGTATPSHAERPFNSAVLVGPDGAEVMRYHKMIPESWFEPGDCPALFEVDGIPCTVIVCHDSRFPELVRLPVLAGARVCFYISYEINGLEAARRKADGYRAQVIARAVENGVWLVQSNGFGPIGAERLSLGSSRIVNPGGTVIAQAPELAGDLLVADLDPKEARRGYALESLESKFFADWWKLGLDELGAWNAGLECARTPEIPRHCTRLALLQEMPKKWDLEYNFGVFLERLDDAAGADILITPECWLDGYAAPDKSSTPERLREVAQPLEGSPYLERVAEEARARGMYICFGFSSLEDGKIYNAVGLWDRQGTRVGVYHKTHLQTHDLQYSPGMALPVWDTEFGPLGIMICADRRWPETARTLRLQGARLILNPTYGMHHLANEWWMRTRAYENQCFIAFAHPETSFVATPCGGLAAKRENRPGVLLCDVNLREARDDNHLRDRRPDLYLLE